MEKSMMQTENAYQKPVTFKNIMKFALPTIAMSLFMAFLHNG